MLRSFFGLLIKYKKRLLYIILVVIVLWKICFFLYNKFFTKTINYVNNIVSVVKVENKINDSVIIGYGNFTNGKIVNIISEASSDVEKIIINGHTKVKKNDLIMVLKDRMVSENFESSKNNVDNALANYQASKEMFNKQLISQSELNVSKATYEAAMSAFKRSKYAKDNIEIRTPFDGTLIDVFVNEGQYVLGKDAQANQTVLYSIIKDGPLSMDIPIQAKYVNTIHKGQKVDILCDYGNFEGFVKRFENSISPKNGYFSVVIASNKAKDIIPGSSCSVKITYQINNSFIIPSDILTIHEEKIGVKVLKDNNIEFRIVKILSDEGDKMVVDGLKDNDLLITSGGNDLKIGSSFDLTRFVIKNV